MTKTEFASKIEELDRLLNDPDTAIAPERVWILAAEIADQTTAARGDPE